MNLQSTIESILFAAGEPVPHGELARTLEVSKPELQRQLERLNESYQGSGLSLVSDDRTVQLVTTPDAAPVLARFRQTELSGKLSPAALETLAVIAYKGPATRPQVDAIRGVHSGQALRTLAIRGLIQDTGHAKEPGRPILYDVTLELYKHLGITGRAELPPIPADLTAKLDAVESAPA